MKQWDNEIWKDIPGYEGMYQVSNIDKIDAYPFATKAEYEQADKRQQREGISKSRKYALAGNSIVVDVLYAIFENMFIKDGADANTARQMTLDL